MTNYVGNINNIQISGDNFDGNYISSPHIILDSTTLSGNQVYTYSLAKYLPDDDYDYLVEFSGRSNTVATSGRTCQLNLFSGSDTTITTNDYGYRLGRITARTNAAQTAGGTARLPIYANDRHIMVKTSDSSYNNTYTYFAVLGYIRVGRND